MKEMKITKKTFTFPTLLITVAMTLLSCAKDVDYRVESKAVEQLEKSSIQTGDDNLYLYVPMTLGSPMNVKNASPYIQGDEKIVTLHWSKEGLDVLEVEEDSRFADNDVNHSPVLTIPGDYKSYRCQTDAYGDCTNVEEEDTYLTWDQKKYFDPRYEHLIVKEVNSLDLFAVENSDCLTVESTKVVHYELDSGIINIELEKTYRAQSSNFSCLLESSSGDDLSMNSFKVRYFYSLVKLNQLASKDYKPIEYPEVDQNKFGFFALENLVLDDDYDALRKNKEVYLERWNPKRKSIDYYLSAEFSKEENAYVKDVAFDTIKQMNEEFQTNGLPLHINLIEQNDANAVSPGDLRYNSIVLIEDPLANNVLGYGPRVTNPLTGEILKASVNMYLGGLKGTTRSIYDSGIDVLKNENFKEKAGRLVKTNLKIADTALSSLLTRIGDN